jgi:hypothetical protein
MLIYFLVFVIAIAVAFYILTLLPPEFQKIGKVVLLVVAGICVIIFLLQLVGGGSGLKFAGDTFRVLRLSPV